MSGVRVAAVRLSDTGSRWLTFDTPVPLKSVGSIVKRKPRRVPRDNHKILEKARKARRMQSTISHDDHLAIAEEYATTDITLQELGDRYGLTGERIRQIISETDPSARARRMARHYRERADRKAAEAWATFWEHCRIALAEDRRCEACGGWVIRGQKNTTCSSECSEARNVLRIFDDPDYHRRALAKTYLANPKKYSGVRIEWAQRMLGPNPPKRNRTFLLPGSKRAEVIKTYRPEQYAALMEEA